MITEIKPPLGITPKYIWKEQLNGHYPDNLKYHRLFEIYLAIRRFEKALIQNEISQETFSMCVLPWLEEETELQQDLFSHCTENIEHIAKTLFFSDKNDCQHFSDNAWSFLPESFKKVLKNQAENILCFYIIPAYEKIFKNNKGDPSV